MRSLGLVFIACSLVAIGCAAPKPRASISPPPRRIAVAAQALPTHSVEAEGIGDLNHFSIAQDSLIQWVPGGAVWAALIRKNALAPLRNRLLADAALQADLSTFLGERLGIDLTRVDGVVAFSLAADASPEGSPTGALLLHMEGGGQIRGQSIGRVGGLDIYRLAAGVVAAAIAGGVVVGSERDVAAEIALVNHELTPIGPESRLAELASMSATGIDVVIAAHAPSVKFNAPIDIVQTYAVKLVMLTFDQHGTLALSIGGADPRKLKELGDVLMQLAAIAMREAGQHEKEAMKSGDLATGITAIATYRLGEQALRESQPRMEGDKLVLRYTLPRFQGTAAFVPYAALAASILLPEFTRYQKREKSSEALINVRAIRDGVIAFHAEHHADSKRFAFPPSTGWTNAAQCCGQPEDLCGGNTSEFAAPTWKALGFSINEPHRYQYRFVSQGKGRAARFTIEARGDLDCDGRYSRFSIEGGIGDKGELEIGEMSATDEME